MTQGALVVGDLIVSFTILTNGNHEEIAKEALALLREARHLKRSPGSLDLLGNGR